MNGQTSKAGRKITAPSRLGTCSTAVLSTEINGSDSESDLTLDDSVADPHYEMPPTPNSDHDHIIDLYTSSPSMDTQQAPKRRKTESNVDFNSEFEAIRSSSANEHDSSARVIAPNAADELKSVDLKLDAMDHGQMIEKLYKNSVEALARLAVIEKALLNKQMLKVEPMANSDMKLKADQLHTFLISNELPLKSIDQIQKFEARLADEKLKKNAVSILMSINAFDEINIHILLEL